MNISRPDDHLNDRLGIAGHLLFKPVGIISTGSGYRLLPEFISWFSGDSPSTAKSHDLAMRQMLVIGHSKGALLTKLNVVKSGCSIVNA